MIEIYKQKYLKYKLKYLNLLENIKGGMEMDIDSEEEAEFDFDQQPPPYQHPTFEDLVLEFRTSIPLGNVNIGLKTLITKMYDYRSRQLHSMLERTQDKKYYELGKPEIETQLQNIITVSKERLNNTNLTISQGLHILLGMNPRRFNNALQPSYYDIFIYDFFYPYIFFSISQFPPKKKWDIYRGLIKNVINVDNLRVITHGGQDDGSILEDLNERARIIVGKIVSNSEITSLKLMDGFGRIIYRCIEQLSLRDIDRNINIKIEVYDLDKPVYIWHLLTLPNNNDGTPSSYNDNIFTQLTDTNLETSLIYLNFSGITSYPNNVSILREKLLILNRENFRNLVISFSYVRGAVGNNNIEELIYILGWLGFQKIDRAGFLTFYI
jgi:hypothetical protein